MYYQRCTVNESIRGKVNVTMAKSMSEMNDPSSPFHKYLNKHKVFVTQESLRLLDARIME
jgi:hypothetical protein